MLAVGGDQLRPLKSCFLGDSDYSCFKGPGRQLYLPSLRTRVLEAKELILNPDPIAEPLSRPRMELTLLSLCFPAAHVQQSHECVQRGPPGDRLARRGHQQLLPRRPHPEERADRYVPSPTVCPQPHSTSPAPQHVPSSQGLEPAVTARSGAGRGSPVPRMALGEAVGARRSLSLSG